MTARQFYDVCADAVSNSRRPLETDYLIFGADNVSTRDGGWFGQRARQRPWVRGLGSEVIDRSCHGGFVAVGIEHLSDKVKADPYRPSLLVRLTQSLEPSVCEFRRNLLQPLVYQAESGLWNHGTQIHQMPSRSASRDQRRRGTAQRVPHDHHVVAAFEGAAHHIRVGVEVCRPIVARQVRRHHVMASLLEKRSHLFPTPSAVPRPVHQRKHRHANKGRGMTPLTWQNRAGGHSVSRSRIRGSVGPPPQQHTSPFSLPPDARRYAKGVQKCPTISIDLVRFAPCLWPTVQSSPVTGSSDSSALAGWARYTWQNIPGCPARML